MSQRTRSLGPEGTYAALRAAGHASMWDYFQANPGIPLGPLGARLGGLLPITVQETAVDECLGTRQMGALLRDLCARRIRDRLPNGWGEADEETREGAADVCMFLRAPYATLASNLARRLASDTSLSARWLPTSGEDEALRRAYDDALPLLPDDARALVAEGRLEPRPGDLYWAVVKPVRYEISIYEGPDVFLQEFRAFPLPVGHLLAIHWCWSEVSNGGLSQFFFNATGVLAPEAVAGFIAVGMPQCASIVAEAMRSFGSVYPRDREERQERLDAGTEFGSFDDRLFALFADESGGFDVAADTYARRCVVA